MTPSFTRREAGLTSAAWGVIAVAAMVLRAAARRLSGHQLLMIDAAVDLVLLAIWAGATPFVLRSAARWPVAGARAFRHAATHLAAGTGFVVLTNILIRVPQVWTRGVTAAALDTLLGIATYYPTAIVSYGVMVAIGQRLFDRVAEVPPSISPDAEDDRLVVRQWNRVHFVELEDVEWIEADNNHVVVHAASRVYKTRERLGDVETRLDSRRFVRVHRSALVQISKIREAQPLTRGDHVVILHSGTVVRVARSRRRALEDALGTPL